MNDLVTRQASYQVSSFEPAFLSNARDIIFFNVISCETNYIFLLDNVSVQCVPGRWYLFYVRVDIISQSLTQSVQITTEIKQMMSAVKWMISDCVCSQTDELNVMIEGLCVCLKFSPGKFMTTVYPLLRTTISLPI